MLKVVGYQEINYTSKKTGLPVVGKKIFCLDSDVPQNTIGCQTCEIFVNTAKTTCPAIEVNSHIDVRYNRYGQVSEVIKLK